jgi:hypothetical protein
LTEDDTLDERTAIPVPDTCALTPLCLSSTFDGTFYEQVEGAAMGSPLSPVIANLFMELLEDNSDSESKIMGEICGSYV